MSSAHTTPQPREDAGASNIDPSKTAKFLANLQRTVGRPRDPDDVAPAPSASPSPVQPVSRAVIAETPAAPAPAATKHVNEATAEPSAPRASSSAKSSRKANKSDKLQVEVTLDPGTASRVVYIRVDKTLADRLALIAFQNKINGGEGPATINDIGVNALNKWLDEYEQAA